ncbi:MAG: hypothetical protein IJ065_06505 [Eubacterium sp.]|nr:hypothetical protein [Eubacterium sp.]
MGLYDGRDDALEFYTSKSLQEITKEIRNAANSLRATVGAIQEDNDPLSMNNTRADIEVYLEGTNFMGSFAGGKYWVVQIYVQDEGEKRHVILLAVGDKSLARFIKGGRNATSLKDGIKKRDLIAARLR